MELDASQLNAVVSDLLRAMTAAELRRVQKAMGQSLANANRQRMMQQIGPDDQRWEPRKPRETVREKANTVRKKATMMMGLRQARHLAVQLGTASVLVGWTGKAAAIATVHHGGLIDRISPNGPRIRYPARPLLGITEKDRTTLKKLMLGHLSQTGR